MTRVMLYSLVLTRVRVYIPDWDPDLISNTMLIGQRFSLSIKVKRQAVATVSKPLLSPLTLRGAQSPCRRSAR